MGNTAVAILHYDMWDQINEMFPRMATAMLGAASGGGVQDFWSGKIISCDDSSAHQFCVIHGNTGARIFTTERGDEGIEAVVADCLRRRGWKCTPPKGGSHG